MSGQDRSSNFGTLKLKLFKMLMLIKISKLVAKLYTIYMYVNLEEHDGLVREIK